MIACFHIIRQGSTTGKSEVVVIARLRPALGSKVKRVSTADHIVQKCLLDVPSFRFCTSALRPFLAAARCTLITSTHPGRKKDPVFFSPYVTITFDDQYQKRSSFDIQHPEGRLRFSVIPSGPGIHHHEYPRRPGCLCRDADRRWKILMLPIACTVDERHGGRYQSAHLSDEGSGGRSG